MTQRIFDVDNPQEIFDLFPDGVIRIEKSKINDAQDVIIFDDDRWDYTHIKINWRGKTEITRPVDESEWVGCLCWFSDSGATSEYIGILNAIDENRDNKYQMKDGSRFSLCRPVRRDEVKFVEDAE